MIAEGVQGRHRWILDPFRFLAGALALPPIPVPDPTTANGRRVMEIHVDGDGFVSVAELPDRPFAGEVIRRDVLARYGFPTTVSIIEGEIGPTGLYPDKSAALEEIARRIFARPEVEIASHSYSHPFDWLRAEGGAPPPDERDGDDPRDGDRLPIPGYTYSLEREIDGSIAYINNRLAPTGKTARVFLWSGDALPPEAALERTQALAVENLNGDNAEEPGPHPALSQVPSFLRPVGGRTQIYAPAQNENVYTNLWRGPYYGFRRVIDYFRFTDSPRRLKPIGIYYHFYSGTKTAAIKALHDVYAWAQRAGNLSRVGERVRRHRSAASKRRRSPAVSTDAGCFAAWARSPPCGCRLRSAGRISTSRRASSACATFPRDVTWRSRPRRIRLWPCPPPRHAGLIFSRPMRPSCPSSAPTPASRCTFAGTCPSRRRSADAPNRFRSTAFRLPGSPLRKASNAGPVGTIQVKGRSLRFESRDTGGINVACE